VDGDKLGRKLGYPTANLQPADVEKIVPGNGIYAVYIEIKKDNSGGGREQLEIPNALVTGAGPGNKDLYKGMMSIGIRPTVGGTKRVIEVNIFDFNRDIYGVTLRVFVKKFLRPEIKFDSLSELVNQIDQDKLDSLKVL
jgi:riboflavin kinase/FMN adenylyltransferase